MVASFPSPIALVDPPAMAASMAEGITLMYPSEVPSTPFTSAIAHVNSK